MLHPSTTSSANGNLVYRPPFPHAASLNTEQEIADSWRRGRRGRSMECGMDFRLKQGKLNVVLSVLSLVRGGYVYSSRAPVSEAVRSFFCV